MSKDAMFHRLWTKAVGTADYAEDEWKQLGELVWGGSKVADNAVSFELRAIAAEEESQLWFDEVQRSRKLFISDENLILTPQTLWMFFAGVESRIEVIEKKNAELEKANAYYHSGIDHKHAVKCRELQGRIDDTLNVMGWAGNINVKGLSCTLAAAVGILRGVIVLSDLRKEGFDIDADSLRFGREKLEAELEAVKGRLEGLVSECNGAIDKNSETCHIVIEKALEEAQKEINVLSEGNSILKAKLKRADRWAEVKFPAVMKLGDLEIMVTKKEN